MHGPLYIRVLGRVKGPFEWEKLRILVKRGQLSRIHEVSVDGQAWVKATEYPELFKADLSELAQPGGPNDLAASHAAAGPAPVTDEPVVAPERVVEQPIEEPSVAGEEAFQVEPGVSVTEEWFYDQNGSPVGPVSFGTLQQLVASGQIFAQGRVWKEGMVDWAAAETIAGLVAPQQPQVHHGGFAEQAMVQPNQPGVEVNQQVLVNNDAVGSRRHVSHVPNHMTKAIIVLLCCNPLFGIIALIFATQVDGKTATGDQAGAMSASKTADLMCNIGILLGVFGIIVWFVFMGGAVLLGL